MEKREFTKDEKSILLYAECCLVDNYGRMNSIRMNKDDFDNLDKMKAEGLLDYGRLPAHEIMKWIKLVGQNKADTHWITFPKKTWKIVWSFRKERADIGLVKLQEIMGQYV